MCLKILFDAKLFSCLVQSGVLEFCSIVTEDSYTASFVSKYEL